MPVAAGTANKKGGGRAKKAPTSVHADTLPDPNGRRIVPSVDEELRKKVEKMDALKSRPPGAGRGKKRKSDGGSAEAKDDLDLLIEGSSKSLKDRLGTSPEAIEKKAKGKS